MRTVFASDFASLSDLLSYQLAKSKGWSDKQAFAVGDNGVGCWGDKTAQLHTPMCALPPEEMERHAGTVSQARHRRIRVTHATKEVTCILADRMPHEKNIHNGCGIDLNPAALAALGLISPLKVEVTYEWI